MSISALNYISFPGNAGNIENTDWQQLLSNATSLSSASNMKADLREVLEVSDITWLRRK